MGIPHVSAYFYRIDLVYYAHFRAACILREWKRERSETGCLITSVNPFFLRLVSLFLLSETVRIISARHQSPAGPSPFPAGVLSTIHISEQLRHKALRLYYCTRIPTVVHQLVEKKYFFYTNEQTVWRKRQVRKFKLVHPQII